MKRFEPLLDKGAIDDREEKIIEKLSCKKDPLVYSSWFSKLFFVWAMKIIRLAKKTPLKHEYLGDLDESQKSFGQFKKVKEIWENNKNLKKNALLKTIWTSNKKMLILIILFNMIKVSFEFITIILLQQYISIFMNKENDEEDQTSPILIGVLLCLFKLFSLIIGRQVAFYQSCQGYKANSELNCLIYNKVLNQSPADNRFSSGQIINLIQWDSVKFATMIESSPELIILPVQVVVYNIMLFNLLGVSYSFGCLLFIGALIYLNVTQKKQRSNIQKISQLKDSRMNVTTELINSLKILKLYAWEDYYMNKVNVEREKELLYYFERFQISTYNFLVFWSIPILLGVVTIGFMQIFEVPMNLASIITSVTIFSMLQDPLSGLPWVFNLAWDVLNSLGRIENYLKVEEVKIEKVVRNNKEYSDQNISISVKNGNFYWKFFTSEEIIIPVNTDEISKLNQITPTIKNINIDFHKNELTAIIGEVGSGKSSFLEAILNNLHSDESTKLFINGEVSYLSQTPWIQNDTLRNNIIFNKEFNEIRYRKVLDLCELSTDISVLINGDLTEIGEKGVNLSGGQKARVALARAVYHESDIYLFDDVIAALDSHVGQKIMNNLIVDYLKEKTRVIVTHSLQYLQYVDRIIYFKNGEMNWIGNYPELIKQDFFKEFSEKFKKIEKEEDEVVLKTMENDGKEDKEEKTMLEEKKEKGSVKFGVYFKYVNYAGGVCLFILVIFFLSIWQGLKNYNDLWLASWAKQENLTKQENWNYYVVYAILGLLCPVFFFFRMYILSRCGLKCSEKLHKNMLVSIVQAPINLFHDVVSKGQILNRFSKDLSTIDTLVYTISYWFVNLISLIGAIIMCLIFMYYSIFFFAICSMAAILITRFSLHGSRELERLEGVTRSPILNQLSETINGATTIRAYEKEDLFMIKFCDKVNNYYKVRLFLHGVQNWFGISLDFISLFFFIFLFTMTILLENSFSSKAVGLMLSYALALERSLFRTLSASSTMENSMVSMERCLEYTKVESENKFITEEDCKIEKWNGKIIFEDYSARYRPNTPLVLKNLNFTINPKEKIGIVGRTGSGKSTICLCLFRIIEPSQGRILIDDTDINTIGLKLIRNRLTIIPQDPALLDGNLKTNIDPLNLYSEEEIINVLIMIGLNLSDLKMEIKENGSNLSVGERQLVCIARAILRKSKIIIMDEATANIDYKTDELIQLAIKKVMINSTVITIAHRIKTILNYDKILVLNMGEMVEFDTPENLISNKDSYFYDLYSKSHL